MNKLGFCILVLNASIQPAILTWTISKRVVIKKIVACIVGAYFLVLAISDLVFEEVFEAQLFNLATGMFVATLLWESRGFNIDSFSFRKVLHLMIFPPLAAMVPQHPEMVPHWVLIVLNALLIIVLSEIFYPLCKRHGALPLETRAIIH